MSNRMDKLFKDKLQADSLQPSAQAWEKVEAHLGKKNKMVVWLRVAASLVLLGLLTVVVLNSFDGYEEPKEGIVKTTTGNEQPADDSKSEIRNSTPNEKPVTRNKKPETSNKKPETLEQVAVVEVQVPQQTDSVVEPRPLNIAPSTLNSAPTKGITLTYSLPSVKKPVAEQTEPVVAKKTGFERVLEIAKEVKNSDNPLGELREAKDDILAFDFRKDKEKKKPAGL